MTARSWIRNLFARPVTRPIRKAPARGRLTLQALEAREVPAAFQDLGFESPGISNYQYNPGGSAWTFAGTSGIAANGSGFTNPDAPEGRQVAILENHGSFSQTADLAAGTYSISFWADQRPPYPGFAESSSQTFNVLVDGNLVGTYQPISTSFRPFSTSSFEVAAGSHTIEFVGTNTYISNQDNTAFIDFITLNQAAPQLTTGAATAVSVTRTFLHGSVNPLGATTSALIQYSTDPTFIPTIARNVGHDFNRPSNVAMDAYGNVFVAVPEENAVYKILPDNSVVSVGSEFRGPSGVAVDAYGNVFVSDTGNAVVKKVLPDNTVVTIGPAFSNPQGVAVDAGGNVYVADNNAIKKVQPDNSVVTIGPGFDDPRGVAVDAAGNVYVTEAGQNTVKKVLQDNTVVSIGSGFNSPLGLAVDGAGNVFVADTGNNAVKKVLPDNSVVTIRDGINDLSSVAVDAAGNISLAVAINSSASVVKLSPPTAGAHSLVAGSLTSIYANVDRLIPNTTYYYRTVASGPSGTVAGPVGAFFAVNPPPAPVLRTNAATEVLATEATLEGVVNPERSTTTALFQYSTDPDFTPTVSSSIITNYSTELIAVDAAGNVFTADDAGVYKILPDNVRATIASGFDSQALAVDAHGNIYVADNGSKAVYKVLPNGTVVTIATGFAGSKGVAVDASGNVYVADAASHTVYKVQTDGTVVTIASGFDRLKGVAVDGDGNVYVIDDGAVKKVLHDSSIVTIHSGFSEPSGVAVDGHSNVYVTDSYLNAVYKILTDGTTLKLFTDLRVPTGVAVDGAGNVYVADTYHSRVVKLSPTSVAATPSPLSGHQPITVSATATGLTPNTTYYYRAVASGPGGLVASDLVESFTTVDLFTTTVNWGTPAAIAYGTPLDAAQLNATADVPGAFAYSPAAGTVLNAGSHTLSVTFTPSDPNYESVSKDVTLTVTQATPTITWATPPPITSGTQLGDAQLNATANVPGSFSYTPAAGTVLDVGSHNLFVNFTPTDTTNYATVSDFVTLTVNGPPPGANLVGSTLVITGSAGHDDVRLARQGGNLRVFANFLPGDAQFLPFRASAIKNVHIDLGEGNDVARMASPIRLPVVMDGGAGDDVLVGGMGQDILLGGEGDDQVWGGGGHDLLVGGAGRDLLHGELGHDILVGGLHRDVLDGGRGTDLLVSGATAFDANMAALRAIRTEWTSSRPYATRIHNLTASHGSIALDYNALVAGTTVHDDGEADVMWGGGERDWLWLWSSDLSLDRATHERSQA